MSVYSIYRGRLKKYLPSAVRELISRIRSRLAPTYEQWRTRRLPTLVFGPRYRRSRDLAEIDITYACNLRCYNCNRSCPQAPTGEHMTVGQVCQFLEESLARQIRWRRLRVVGGEPTTHPNFLEIMNLLVEYRQKHRPGMRIEVTTNGHGERVNRMLSLLPLGVVVNNSAKESAVQPHFDTFNIAPIDVETYQTADFSNACRVAAACGLGVTPYGYYPCAVAGGIDRIFGFDLGKKELPETDDDMTSQLRRFCALCGHFKLASATPVTGPQMSSTWERAYALAVKDPPHLSRLPECGTPAAGHSGKAPHMQPL
jgi:hypothetical protein